MSTPVDTLRFFRIDDLSVLDIDGADADLIVHNLTTNEIKRLAEHAGCESFVTDVRGKILGHVNVFRTKEGFRFIGAAGQSESLAAHADRYTIREDATPRVRDAELGACLLPTVAAKSLVELSGAVNSGEGNDLIAVSLDGLGAIAYQVAWVGAGSWLLVAGKEDVPRVAEQLTEFGLQTGDIGAFHHHRTIAGYPWYGVDLSDKNLPQEADRNTAAICFNKGCYLGQETVARLDALGQVQKKLVRWSISGGVPAVGSEVTAGDKVVGRLTSVAAMGDFATDVLNSGQTALAIGMARRSHFDAGSIATGMAGPSGQEFVATVVE